MSEDKTASSAKRTAAPTYTLVVSESERQILTMALGELLQTVERDEHLIPQIQALIVRLKNATPAV